ncbi:MAG: hypothetical protein CSA65_01875 [Proteobacteria bacterium]|nr:MAG: hypothetical protein CSA65_01875 [Pseudomonadota bacterium]
MAAYLDDHEKALAGPHQGIAEQPRVIALQPALVEALSRSLRAGPTRGRAEYALALELLSAGEHIIDTSALVAVQRAQLDHLDKNANFK